MDNLPPKEISDEEMINQAFHELLNDYLNTKHRKKVEIITIYHLSADGCGVQQNDQVLHCQRH